MDEKNICNLCNGNEVKILTTAKDYRYHMTKNFFNLVRCNNCGLVYIDPKPDKKEIINYYPFEDYYFIKKKPIVCIINNFFLKRKATIIKKYKNKGKLLDIGCGDGSFLYKMEQNGFDVFGLDISKEVCNIATEKLDCKSNIFNTDLKDCNFPDRYFDVITLWHVLEHVPYPKQELFEINRILKDDGLLILGLPNIDSFAFKVFKKYWFNLDIPRHYYHFSTKSISKMLSSTGFKITKKSFFALNFPFDLTKSFFTFLKEKIINNFIIILIIILLITLSPFIILITGILNTSVKSQAFEVICFKNIN